MTDERRKPSDSANEFQRCYQDYLPLVIAFFRRRGLTADEARDLAQDTFVRVLRGWETFRGESSYKTWILRIATNIWRNELRARSTLKREALPLESFDESSEAASNAPAYPYADNGTNETYAAVWARQRRELMHRALRELPPQMRRCLLLHVGGDLKYREIAGIMQLSIGAVKAQLSFAQARLRSQVGDALSQRAVASGRTTPPAGRRRGH